MEHPNEHHYLYKRLIVECDQWISRNVVCFGNQMHHTEEQKEAFIAGIGERIAKQVIPQQPESALTIAFTIYTLVEQQAWIEYWKYQLSCPVRLFSDIEAITRQIENHHNLQKPLQVKYNYGTEDQFIDEVRLNPAEVVCVLSYAKDDRRIILERKRYNDRQFKCNAYILDRQYLPNDKGLNYENLRDYLDPLKIHLVVANNAIVNEAFYDFDGDNLKLNPEIKLIITINGFDNDKFKEIILNKRAGDKKKAHQELIACRENKRNQINSLQKLSSFYTHQKEILEGK